MVVKLTLAHFNPYLIRLLQPCDWMKRRMATNPSMGALQSTTTKIIELGAAFVACLRVNAFTKQQ